MSIIEPLRYPAPYLSTPGCSVCQVPNTVTFDLYNGRRCGSCGPKYDPNVAVSLLMAGWPGTAASYVRSWAA